MQLILILYNSQSFMLWAMCFGSLSCWNQKSSQSFKSCALCFKFSFNIFRYPIWFKEESIKVNRLIPLAAIYTTSNHYATSNKFNCRHKILLLERRTLFFSTTGDWCQIQNLFSSKNITFSQNWVDLFTYSFRKVNRFCLLTADVCAVLLDK